MLLFAAMRYRVGEHVLDLRKFELRDGDRLVPAEPQVLSLLFLLIENRDRLVSKDELVANIWDGRAVSDSAISSRIKSARQLLGDDGEAQRLIRTVHGKGFRFVGDVSAEADSDRAPGSNISSPSIAVPSFDPTGATGEPASEQSRSRRWFVQLSVLAAFVVLSVTVLFVAHNRAGRADDARVSIAVLPFRNLAPGDPYFAEGVSEEILSRLAREPEFRVAGRTSSSQFRDSADLRKVGRALDVDYILEGSVRSQAHQVRVDAALVQASSGKQLWSKSFDGKLDDIFAIQDEIGGSVASALGREFAGRLRSLAPPTTRGDAYNLYLTARGLIRTRDINYGQTAIELLSQALKIDPKYAPAWAKLSEATRIAAQARGPEAVITATPLAEAQARRALALAPDLAEGHAALGLALGFASPGAQQHLRRAAELDPANGEALVWLGIADKAAGEFDSELADYRKAIEIDPLWFNGQKSLAIAVADRGQRRAAEAIARRAFSNDPVGLNMLMGRIAWSFGDFSEAIRYWADVVSANSPRWGATARQGIATGRFLTGATTQPPAFSMAPAADLRRGMTIAWMDAPPTPALWQQRNRNAVAAQVWHSENLFAAKLMVKAGRATELLQAYDGAGGLLGIGPGQHLWADQLADVPVVALALRQGNRGAEADRLLGEAEALIDRIYRWGSVPSWFDADAAAVWAVHGKTNEALAGLERAYARGWRRVYATGPLDIAEEPAFRGLREQPRFIKLRNLLGEHLRQEREQIASSPG